MERSLFAGAVRLECASRVRKARVTRILETLFCRAPLNLCVSDLCVSDRGMELLIHDLPEGDVCGDPVFDAPLLSAIRTRRGYHLRSGGSFLSLDLHVGTASGFLSDAFLDLPPEDQRGLFLFAFLLLLSVRGVYALHAGGVVWQGCGFLLAGRSGSGKTTLSYALMRSGWQYLSDDSVLLRRRSSGVEALAFGRPFHCAPAMFRYFPELARAANRPVCGKRLVDVLSLYPCHFRSALRPQVILFPEVDRSGPSRIIPLSDTDTLVRLLGECSGLLYDRDAMAGQMTVLGDLAGSTRGFRLMHGADVHTDPRRVAELLQQLAKPDQTPGGAHECEGRQREGLQELLQ